MSKIAIIIGTNRQESLSSRLASVYHELLTSLGADAEIIDLRELPDDFIATALYDNAGKNAAFNRFRKVMLESEKYVFIVPEYNGSFPGVLKAFIDGLKYPETFTNKKSAMVGLSSGNQGAGLAMSHLTDILNYCGTHVLALKVKMAFINRHFVDGEIQNELYTELLAQQARQLIDF